MVKIPPIAYKTFAVTFLKVNLNKCKCSHAKKKINRDILGLIFK